MNYQRLLLFVIILFLAIHLTACFFLFAAFINSTEIYFGQSEGEHKHQAGLFDQTWLRNFPYEEMNHNDLYCLAIYWSVQTFTTIGYGDVGNVNVQEKMFCSAIMLVGVLAYSYATGVFTSII